MTGRPLHNNLERICYDLGDSTRGCALLQGTFALSIDGAFLKILNTWGSRLTWTAQRKHVAEIVGSMDTFYASTLSLVVLGQGAGWDGGGGSSVAWVGGQFSRDTPEPLDSSRH